MWRIRGAGAGGASLRVDFAGVAPEEVLERVGRAVTAAAPDATVVGGRESGTGFTVSFPGPPGRPLLDPGAADALGELVDGRAFSTTGDDGGGDVTLAYLGPEIPPARTEQVVAVLTVAAGVPAAEAVVAPWNGRDNPGGA